MPAGSRRYDAALGPCQRALRLSGTRTKERRAGNRNSFKHLPGSGIYIIVKRLLHLLTAALLVFTGNAYAAHTRATLLLSATTAKAGDTILAGVRLQMDPGWHTYWKNPGASGMATKIEWQLPPGITAGAIEWPLPEKLPAEELTTYVYHDEVVLLVPLKLAADLKPGPLELKAEVSWLECEVSCVPGSASLQARLVIGSDSPPSPEAATLQAWQSKVPQVSTTVTARAAWDQSPTGDTRPLMLEWSAPAKVRDPDFFPEANDAFEVEPATEILSTGPTEIRLRKLVKKNEGDWPREISGVLVQKSGDAMQGFAVTLPIANNATNAGPATTSPGGPAKSLWQMLLYAFIGGLILNIMPCVLPVIALKILGFVGQSKEVPGRVRKLGLIYAVGVLVSFAVLAALVIGVKAAGRQAGWGMQFSNPQFIVILTVLVLLVALNLFGVFEVTLSGRVMGAAGGLATQHGASGAFFNGVLATILATPCTAPFLGAALGFAFAQPARTILLMFLTIGAGLAAPYVVLSWQPAWLKSLPKPGAWMERFKIAMGFPMLATAVWLLNLTPTYYGKRVWWLGLFLVLVALAAWIFGEFFQRGRSRKGIALIVALGVLAVGYAYALERELRWRDPLAENHATALQENPDGIAWQRWSPEAVTRARAEGRPVFVDFTADWCVTCQVNKKTSIEIPAVRAKLKEINAVALLGDYTRFPENITSELKRYDRAGVPLVLVYPKNAAAPPIVLPEFLTPGLVLDALTQAGGK